MNPYLKEGLCLAGAAILATSALAQGFAVDSSAFDNGGGTSIGGVFEMSGILGQQESVGMNGGIFSLKGEFLSLMAGDPKVVAPTGLPTSIFDNTTGSDNGGFGVTATTWLASRLCLGSQSYQLDSVSLLLNSQDFSGAAGPPAVVQLQIYGNDPVSGKPSTNTGVLMNLSSHTNPVALIRGQQWVRWTNATSLMLAGDTCYWVVLSRESGGPIGQIASFTKPAGGAGAFGASSSSNSGATWGTPTEASNNKMLIQATASPVTPAFAITAFRLVEGQLNLGFHGVAGQGYVIESRSEIAVDEWVAVQGSARDGAGIPIEVNLSMPIQQPRQFYRVRKLP